VCAGCSPRTPQITTAEGYVNVSEGIELYYQSVGAATAQDTIMVLHGGPGAGIYAVKEPLIPLADHFVLLFFDQRGGGRSSLPQNKDLLDGEYFIKDIEMIRRHFSMESVNLLAHSFGAILGAEYAGRYPYRIERMAFIGAVGPSREEAAKVYGASPASPDTVLSNRAGRLISELLEGTADNPVENCRDYEKINRMLAEMRGETITWTGTVCDAPSQAVAYYYHYTAQITPKSFGNWDYTQSMDLVNAPLLVVHGEEDSTGVYSQKLWTETFQNGQLFTVEDAGKSAITDQPEQVISRLVEFFKK
jgi:proline iminopeptidase